MQVIDGLVAHPRREALVEPQIVPPGHRDEVAEPLVGHLVGDDRGDNLTGDGRAVLRVNQQGSLAVCYRSPVLHRSGGEVRQRYVVEFGQWVRYSEVVVEVGQQ